MINSVSSIVGSNSSKSSTDEESGDDGVVVAPVKKLKILLIKDALLRDSVVQIPVVVT